MKRVTAVRLRGPNLANMSVPLQYQPAVEMIKTRLMQELLFGRENDSHCLNHFEVPAQSPKHKAISSSINVRDYFGGENIDWQKMSSAAVVVHRRRRQLPICVLTSCTTCILQKCLSQQRQPPIVVIQSCDGRRFCFRVFSGGYSVQRPKAKRVKRSNYCKLDFYNGIIYHDQAGDTVLSYLRRSKVVARHLFHTWSVLIRNQIGYAKR